MRAVRGAGNLMGFEKADGQEWNLGGRRNILGIDPQMRNIRFVYRTVLGLVIEYSKAGLFKFLRTADRKDLLLQIGHAAKIRNNF